MPGYGSAGKFYFLSLLVTQLGGTMDWMCFPWQPRSAQG